MSKHEQFDLTEIGKRLRNLRAHQRKTQSQMAKELGISLSHYSKLEIGIGGMSHGLALALCRQFSLPEEWLLYGKGPQPDLADVKVPLRITRGQQANAPVMLSTENILTDEKLEEIMAIVLSGECQPLAQEISKKMNISMERALAMLVREKLRESKEKKDSKKKETAEE